MEESEKRRERLKAMRAVAAKAEENKLETSAVPGSLANTLLDSPASMSGQVEPCATPRFDFYTDPMAAFSSNKRSLTGKQVDTQSCFSRPTYKELFSSPRPGHRGAEMTSFPAHQMPNIDSPNQRMYQAQGPYPPYENPRGNASSFPLHQGTPPQVWSGSGGTPGHYSTVVHGGMNHAYHIHQRSPSFRPVGSPNFSYGRGRAHWMGNSPSPDSGYGGSPNSSGRDQRQRWCGGMSPGFGRSSGRGRGFDSHSASDESLGPAHFYHQSMVEDPWQHLEPVLWRGLDAPLSNLNTPGSSNPWLAESSSTKKPRVSEPSNKSSSQQSLAEYLAASFHEAVNDEPTV